MESKTDNLIGKTITLDDVAKEAGVSRKTVSRVINANGYVSEATRQRVEAVVRKLGYRPNLVARTLASARSTVIGLMIPGITNRYFSQVIAGVESIAQENQYSVLLLNTYGDFARERDAIRLLEEHRVDGLVYNTPTLPVAELRQLLPRQKAVVIIGHDPIEGMAGTVNVDVYSAMIQAVEHLVDVGRRRIAYVKPGIDERYPHRKRLEGLREAFRRLKLDVPPLMVEAVGGSIEDTSNQVEAWLSTKPDVDAIICYNDEAAVATIDACDRLGIKIPDDIAIVGFDDISLSRIQRISLTTFRIPRYEVGVAAARILFEQIHSTGDTSEVILQSAFVKRNSTPA
ncbi:LacI family DNA-binding transcriptional regulator [Phototrophicus methaneseepsis]|uniref:LacI family DNA-binding transcriptional regulator n=1 Tax=Phototrophicus methaneseepsis TaxID=2710758 RepID=A0A7S8EE02_9CHLR|nr:LacI family DNA-binding transcriptional regulator [Phototrophicus methaneseepsis]QPC84983.1 LacI family DNA-binding transcriptional regulator [Phototrophicus methaneseepsis]